MLEPLYALAVLACPAGMGLMMWMMMRGRNNEQPADAEEDRSELARLRAQIDQLEEGGGQRSRGTAEHVPS